MHVDTDWVAGMCFAELTRVQQFIKESAWHDKERCFEPVQLPTQRKTATVIDLTAEAMLTQGLRRALAKANPIIVGEESLLSQGRGLGGHNGIALLLDAIDGTSLLEHGLDSWCSAVTVFSPAGGQILASLVAMPSGVRYVATERGAWKLRRQGRGTEKMPLNGPSPQTDLASASVAFYGYRYGR